MAGDQLEWIRSLTLLYDKNTKVEDTLSQLCEDKIVVTLPVEFLKLIVEELKDLREKAWMYDDLC